MNISATIKRLKVESAKSSDTKLSAYIPMHPKTNTQNYQQDVIRLKNFLKDARHELKNDANMTATLKKLEGLSNNFDFLEHQSATLAIFAAPDEVTTLKLPIETEYRVQVSKNFLMEPLYLIRNLMLDAYVVDVNLSKPRLFHGDSAKIAEISTEVKSYEDFYESNDYQPNHQFHASGKDGKTAMFHGHGSEADQKKADEMFYLQHVAKKLNTTLKRTRQLVFLAGDISTVSDLKPLLHQPNVTPLSIGNIEHKNEAEIHNLLNEELAARTITSAQKLSGNSRLVTGVRASLDAISLGRAKNLFVPTLRITSDSVRSGIQKRFVMSIPKNPNVLKSIRTAIESGAEVFPVQTDDLKSIAFTARY